MATAEQPLAAVETPVAATPSVESTPAAVETPAVSTPSAETTPQPKDPETILREAVRSHLPVDAEGNLVDPKKDAPKVEPVKTQEQIDAEKKAAETPTEETPEQKAEREKAEADKANRDAGKTEPNPLDKLGALPAEKLAEALKNTPELEAALTKAGIDKDVLFQTARDAALTGQYQELFPTIEAAQFANESAGNFYKLEEGFPAIQTIEDLDNFIADVMLPLSVINGPDGKPLMEADGKTMKTDGSVSRFLKLGTDYDMGMSVNIAEKILEAANAMADGEAKTAQKEYAENLKAAIDFVQEFRNNGYRMPTQKSGGAELSQEQKDKLAQADRTLAQAREKEAETARQQEDLFDKRVEDATVTSAKGLISELLNLSNLNDKAKESAAKEIWVELAAELTKDNTFKRLAGQYRSRGLTDDTQQKLVALNTNTIKAKYAKIVERVVAERGGQIMEAAKARQQKIDTQIDKDRINPSSTSSAAAKGPTPLTDQAIRKQAYDAAKAENGGKEPDMDAVFNKILELKGARLSA